MVILGIDIGGSGIKGAPVDTATGELVGQRHRVPTPQPATPPAVAEAVGRLVEHFAWRGPVGCGLPAVVQDGIARTAANISADWIDTDAGHLFEQATGCRVAVANDADAAGLAEMRFGAGRDRSGTVLVLTLGTGIGSALFHDGVLVPNTELGHLELDGRVAEKWAAASVRESRKLGWSEWARRLGRYLKAVHAYLWPDLIILGGGVSRKHERFIPLLKVPVEVVPAEMRNDAGVVGAALVAAAALD